MRMKEDSHSWKASGIRRRDFRSAHNGPDTPRRSGTRKRKDTRRWCRGIEGREHRPVYVQKNAWHAVDRCEVCGKEVKNYWLYRLADRESGFEHMGGR